MQMLRNSIISKCRKFSTQVAKKKHCCKLLIVGGGTGGCSVAARFSKILHKNDIIVIEPEDIHFYKSSLTFIGAGIKKISDAVKPVLKVLPENVIWIQNSVKAFSLDKNRVTLKNEYVIEYEFMVVALGLKLDYDKVPGLETALDEYSNVCTIYSPKYVEKTLKCLREFALGVALFTAPSTPTTCFAASQKICFLAEHFFRKAQKRNNIEMVFTSGQPTLFPVKLYEKALRKVMGERQINVNLNANLIEVIPNDKKAIFECVTSPGKKVCLKYSMLHVTPPMSPPVVLKSCKELVNESKYVDVDFYTLQHKTFKNVYALGDCISSPLTKTASAVGIQSEVIFKNILNAMNGKLPEATYNGYVAYPIITSYDTAILAEFDYSLKPYPTFPLNSDVERRSMFLIKKHVTPILYWDLLLKGFWSGPEFFRKLFHFQFFSRTSTITTLTSIK